MGLSGTFKQVTSSKHLHGIKEEVQMLKKFKTDIKVGTTEISKIKKVDSSCNSENTSLGIMPFSTVGTVYK